MPVGDQRCPMSHGPLHMLPVVHYYYDYDYYDYDYDDYYYYRLTSPPQ